MTSALIQHDHRHLALVTVNNGHTGGMQTFTRRLLGSALEHGWRVTVGLSGDDVYGQLAARYPSRIKVDRLDWVDSTLKGDRSYGVSGVQRAWKWFRTIRPDVVLFVQSSNTPFRASVMGAWLAGVPIVTTHRTMADTRELLPSKRHLHGLLPGLGLHRRKVVLKTWLTAAMARRVVYNNHAVRRGYEHGYGFSKSKGVVIPNAVDLDVNTARTKPRDALVVGYVGRLGFEKRLDILFEAFAQLDRRREVTLSIFGDGPDRPRLEGLARKLDIAARVRFHGEVSDVAAAYAACDIVALCSMRESSSNMILEAMAAGKAVVVTNVGGLPELIGHGTGGMCVPPLDPDALATTLSTLIDHPAERGRLGASAVTLARTHHAPDRVAGMWLTLLESTAGKTFSAQKSPGRPSEAAVIGLSSATA